MKDSDLRRLVGCGREFTWRKVVLERRKVFWEEMSALSRPPWDKRGSSLYIGTWPYGILRYSFNSGNTRNMRASLL